MKIRRGFKNWVMGAFALVLLTGSPLLAADGDPDVKREVRAKMATQKLKERPNVALLYVKGMV